MPEIKGFRPEEVPWQGDQKTKEAELNQRDFEVKGFSRPIGVEDLERVQHKTERTEEEASRALDEALSHFLNSLYNYPPALVRIIKKKLTGGRRSNVFDLELMPERLTLVLEDIEQLPAEGEREKERKEGLKRLCADFKSYLEDFFSGKLEPKKIKGFSPDETGRAA